MMSLHTDEDNGFPLTLLLDSSAVSMTTNTQSSTPGVLSSTIYTKVRCDYPAEMSFFDFNILLT
jgi:hypothetical protein